MMVLRESPWYQEILSEGEVKGRQEGRQEEGVALVLRQLNRRLGNVSDEMRVRVQSLSVAQVEMLAEALLDFTGAADLEAWMRSPENVAPTTENLP
jgi:predicted transposase YdaD